MSASRRPPLWASDQHLVDLVRAGDEEAFEAIVRRYRPQLLRYCRRLLGGALGEDAVQETFVHAFKGLRAGSGELSLRPWLYRVAFNVSLDLLRRERPASSAAVEHLHRDVPAVGGLEHRDDLDAVLRALNALPARQREALVLQAFEGRRYDEIAVALGASQKAVRQLLNRARSTLREARTDADAAARRDARRRERRGSERRATGEEERRREDRRGAHGERRARCERRGGDRRGADRRRGGRS